MFASETSYVCKRFSLPFSLIIIASTLQGKLFYNYLQSTFLMTTFKNWLNKQVFRFACYVLCWKVFRGKSCSKSFPKLVRTHSTQRVEQVSQKLWNKSRHIIINVLKWKTPFLSSNSGLVSNGKMVTKVTNLRLSFVFLILRFSKRNTNCGYKSAYFFQFYKTFTTPDQDWIW